ncbi:MAG: lytic transglycosylase domain-containing protein [Elusimicrobia bacterium]|nr:lytic transglycosylase domain-containing protein [Elusimicrobiota bacterium]
MRRFFWRRLQFLLIPATILGLCACEPEEPSSQAAAQTGALSAPESPRFGRRQEPELSPEALKQVEQARKAKQALAGASATGGASQKVGKELGRIDARPGAGGALFDGSGNLPPLLERKISAAMYDEGIHPRIVDVVLAESRRQKADPLLVFAVMKKESNFNPKVTSPKGARGLMQVMPSTGKGYGNLYNIENNVRAGVSYLAKVFDKFSTVSMAQLSAVNPFSNDGIKAAIAAYNAGDGAVEKYGGVPPFRETQNFVVDILETYQGYLRLL